VTALPGVEAIAPFGSAARGDSDSFSDRDILLLCRRTRDARAASLSLKARGWSPTLYTWNRLDRAAASGSLFVQHLKTEARVLRDSQGKLESALAKFEPNSSYEPERRSAAELLRLLDEIPDTPQGRLWAMDVLWVGFRSLAIARLANDGVYAFALTQIIEELVVRSILRRSDESAIRIIRRHKWSYRRRDWRRAPTWNETRRLVGLVARRFRLDLYIHAVDACAIIERATSCRGGALDEWYKGSRALEIGVLMLEPDRRVDRSEVRTKGSELLRVISAPTEYGWLIRRDLGVLRDQLSTIARCGIYEQRKGGRAFDIVGERQRDN
jgi:hypothetical protein